MKKHQLNDFEIKSFDDEQGIVECYGNVKYHIDAVRDVTVDGAFEKSIEKHIEKGSRPKMLWNHERGTVIGTWEEFKEDEKGLWMKGRIALGTEKGREVYELLKMKAIDSLSIGYRVIKETYDRTKNVNFLEELDVVECSFVPFPCNDASTVVSVKEAVESDESDEPVVVEPEETTVINIENTEADTTLDAPEPIDESEKKDETIAMKLKQVAISISLNDIAQKLCL